MGTLTHRIGGNLKLLQELANADRKRLAFSIANCRFRLPISIRITRLWQKFVIAAYPVCLSHVHLANSLGSDEMEQDAVSDQVGTVCIK